MKHYGLHHLSLLVLALFMTACVGTDALRIHSQPEGAKLYVNSKYVGLTPQEVPQHFAGMGGPVSHVELVKEGYRTRQETITHDELIHRYFANDVQQGSRYGVGNTFDFTYPLEASGSTAPAKAPVVRRWQPASPAPRKKESQAWR